MPFEIARQTQELEEGTNIDWVNALDMRSTASIMTSLLLGTARNRSDDPSGPLLVVDQVAAAVTDSEGGTFCPALN